MTALLQRRRVLGVLLLTALLLPLQGALPLSQPAEGLARAVVPGRYIWAETVTRGDTFRLAISDTAGRTRTFLTGQSYGRPAFSPDGTQVAWAAPRTNGSDGRYVLWVANVNGSNKRIVSSPTIGDFDPAWAPDGSALLVSRDERGNFEPNCCSLWVIGLRGQGERRVSGATSARQPAWSPDGRAAAYTAPDGIRTIPIGGGTSRRVASGSLSWPAFSPTGARIAAVERTGPSTGNLVFFPGSGGTATKMDAGLGRPEAPRWTGPEHLLHLDVTGAGENGRRSAQIVYTSTRSGTVGVFSTGRPMYYMDWTRGGTQPGTGWLDAVKTQGTGSGKTELHGMPGASNYTRFGLQTATALGQLDPAQWWVGTGGYTGRGRADVVAVRRLGGASGRMEVHVVSAASGYKTFALHAATPMHSAGSNWHLSLADTGRGPDLYMVNTGEGGSTRSGRVEVHVLSAASGYRQFSGHYATHMSAITRPWRFVAGSRSGDVIGVMLAGTPEVHVMARRTGYKSWVTQTRTPLPIVVPEQWTFSSGDDDGDGRPDLFAVQTLATTSGRTEISVLTAALGYARLRRDGEPTALGVVDDSYQVRARP